MSLGPFSRHAQPSIYSLIVCHRLSACLLICPLRPPSRAHRASVTTGLNSFPSGLLRPRDPLAFLCPPPAAPQAQSTITQAQAQAQARASAPCPVLSRPCPARPARPALAQPRDDLGWPTARCPCHVGLPTSLIISQHSTAQHSTPGRPTATLGPVLPFAS